MVDIFKLNTKELQALVTYKEVLNGSERFPKDFWTEEKNQPDGIKLKSRVLTRYCLENLADLKTSDLSSYNLKQLKSILIRGKLFGMVQRVFSHDVLMILKNAYPQEFRSRELKEWMWSKHGVWNDKKMIIEAVQDMVLKEGIRRVEDIPSFDWKKRLLKHGIYNVLANFNWSIFALFNFVYPSRFHPADFKYKTKWAASKSFENAFYFMHKTFKKKRYTLDQIMLLSTSDFRKLGLAGMLMSLFGSSTLKAKEYYLYKTVDNKDHQEELLADIKRLVGQRYDNIIKEKLAKAAKGKFIYNLHSNSTLYGYIKRHAKKRNLTINELISSFGYVYKSAKKDIMHIPVEKVWSLRKQRKTYIEIAEELDSNPTTINEICLRHFGGDPLIPRPIDDYITVQELMNKYHVDHKTIMKLVNENGLENHTTIRLRYLKKAEIEPLLKKYIRNSLQHKAMVSRYAN